MRSAACQGKDFIFVLLTIGSAKGHLRNFSEPKDFDVCLVDFLDVPLELYNICMVLCYFENCCKPCSTGTHNETVKQLALFSAIINGVIVVWNYGGITASSLNPLGVFQFFSRIENSVTFTP